jgi:WD40 repeat protein
VYVQDLAKPSSAQYKVLSSAPHRVTSVVFDKSGSAMAVGTDNGETTLFDVETEQKLRILPGIGPVNALAWNLTAPYMLTTGAQTVVNHDVRMRSSVINKLEGHTGSVSTLKWSMHSDPCQTFLASGDSDCALGVIRLADLL